MPFCHRAARISTAFHSKYASERSALTSNPRRKRTCFWQLYTYKRRLPAVRYAFSQAFRLSPVLSEHEAFIFVILIGVHEIRASFPRSRHPGAPSRSRRQAARSAPTRRSFHFAHSQSQKAPPHPQPLRKANSVKAVRVADKAKRVSLSVAAIPQRLRP